MDNIDYSSYSQNPAEQSWWTKTYGDYKPYGEYTPYDKLKYEDIPQYRPDMSNAFSGSVAPYQNVDLQNYWLEKKRREALLAQQAYIPMFSQFYQQPSVVSPNPAFAEYRKKS